MTTSCETRNMAPATAATPPAPPTTSLQFLRRMCERFYEKSLLSEESAIPCGRADAAALFYHLKQSVLIWRTRRRRFNGTQGPREATLVECRTF